MKERRSLRERVRVVIGPKAGKGGWGRKTQGFASLSKEHRGGGELRNRGTKKR